MGHFEPCRPTGRPPKALIAALAAIGVASAGAAAEAAPLWQMDFLISFNPAKAFGRGVRWIKRPPNSQIFAHYPEGAFRDHVSGVATLECAATAQGGFEDCTVVEEKPEDSGFAEASRKVLALYQFGPVDKIKPEIVGKRVKVAIVWSTRRNLTRETRP